MPRPSRESCKAGTLKYRDLSIAHFAGRFSKTSPKLIRNRPFSHQRPCAPSRERHNLAAHWQELTVFPADFDRLAAAAVWGVPEELARDDLGGLLERNLLLYDEERGRYRLHDLMRPVAREVFGYAGEARDPDAEAGRIHRAAARHATYFKDVLAQAETMYLQGGEHVQDAMSLYELERENILTGQAWASVHADSDDEVARLTSGYPDGGIDVLRLRLHPRQRIAWLEDALTASRRLGIRESEANHLGNLGIAYRNLGETLHAIAFFERQLAITREIGDRRAEGNALGNLGLAYANLGETLRAIELYEQALAISREISDRRAEGRGLGNLGLAYAALGEVLRAIEFFGQALAIARAIGDRHGEERALGNLGNACRALGEPRRAIEFHKQELAIAQEIGDRHGEGFALGNLGLAYKDLGDAPRAIEFHEQHLAIVREFGNRRGEGIALGNLGTAYADLGKTCRAIEFHERALAIAQEISDRHGEANACWNKALALNQLGRPSEAIAAAANALAIFEKIEHPHASGVRRQLTTWREEQQRHDTADDRPSV